MFEEYLEDSHDFLMTALTFVEAKNEREAQRYFRASVFYAFSSIESFINYYAEGFEKAERYEKLSKVEIYFLNDKTMFFDGDKSRIKEKTEFHKIEHKIRLLMKKFVPAFDFDTYIWNDFTKFKEFRDSLVHPRKNDDETTLEEYKTKLSRGITSIIQIMNNLCIGMLQKPLRPKLLDLLPE